MFKLEIRLGNEAMQSPEDVMGALRKVINRLEDGNYSGCVMDDNGNKVGEWSLDVEE